MTKVKMTSTGVHLIDGLFLQVNGQQFRLKTVLFSQLDKADPKRLVAILRQHDFDYAETSLGYVWKFIHDEKGIVHGTVHLGTNDKGIGTYSPIKTTDIIGWCYLDELKDNK